MAITFSKCLKVIPVLCQEQYSASNQAIKACVMELVPILVNYLHSLSL